MKKFLTSALIRGLLWQLIGWIVGALFVTGIRVLMGLNAFVSGQYFFTEPAWVFGGLVGALSYVASTGAMTDWFKWAKGDEVPEHREDPPGWEKYLNVSLDHKVIGVQYTVTALFLLCVGGLFAMIFRTELAHSGLQFLTLQEYNTFMSLHGIVMIVGILLGVAGLMNYLVPMLIGAQDMAFPRLNAFSYWVAPPAAILLLSTLVFGGFDTGWTGYPPLSERAPLGMQMFFLGVAVAGWASISRRDQLNRYRCQNARQRNDRIPNADFCLGRDCNVSDIFNCDSVDWTFFPDGYVPASVWNGIFRFDKGGNPILFQHLFWFYSHPAVYVFVLPGLGIISELVPVFVRKPLFGYRFVAMSSLGIALVGFLVWAHHMFVSGMNPYLRIPFMFSTLLVAVPTGVKFFSWIATIWKGKIEMPTPMLFVVGGIVVFLLGGLSGPPNATVATDLHLQNTYWIVGHFHDTMFGGYIYPFFAAIYYWFPKVTGRKMNEKLGKIHFWMMTPSFLTLTLLMMRVGLLGMRRRVADYDPALGFDTYHLIMTIAGYLIAISVLIFLYNLFVSIKNGETATGNVWNSRSPEWLVPSPMPVHNYENPFEVVGEPYDYGLPGSVYVRFEDKKSKGH